MTRRRHRRTRGHRAQKRSELGRARFVDPAAYAVFRGCARKVRFATEQAALERGSLLGLRCYPCRYCAGWHLTSQDRAAS